MQPTTVHDGLALYRIGSGEPVLLLPYPHAMTVSSMAESPLARILVEIGRTVLTFDPPGAYASTRKADCTLAEMLECAADTLDYFDLPTPTDVVGHSMGAFCGLAFALEHPEQVRRLVLVGATSGFPAVMRWGIPHNWRWWRDVEWWYVGWLGTRVMLGLDSLAVHKRLSNAVAAASYVDEALAPVWAIEPGDRGRVAPPRIQWQRNVRRYDLAGSLGDLNTPTLLVYGRHDPQTPLAMAHELLRLLPNARLEVLDGSGHSPFDEEPDAFIRQVREFICSGEAGPSGTPR